MAKIIHDLSLLDIAPPSISNDENVKSIIEAVNPELKSVSEAISDAFIISRVNELPERVIDLLAWQWHVDFYEPDLDIATKRSLVLNSIKYHRKKGTKYAIKSALEALGFVPTIKEWFEPEMQTAPHTFSIKGYYKDDPINADFLGEDTEEILKRVVEITKPVRSGLIYLLVAPPPMDLSEHICRWDFCTWEHFTLKNYDWGLLTPEDFSLDDNAVIKRDFERDLFTIHDTAFWDVNTWDGVPVRLLQAGQCSETVIFANYEWGEGEHALLYPALWDYSRWGYAATFTRSVGSVIERIFGVNYDIDNTSQILNSIVENKFLYDTRPRWDLLTWQEHDKWIDDFAEDITASFSHYRALEADLSSSIFSKWSKKLTWQNNKTWINTTEQNCTWEIKSWEED